MRAIFVLCFARHLGTDSHLRGMIHPIDGGALLTKLTKFNRICALERDGKRTPFLAQAVPMVFTIQISNNQIPVGTSLWKLWIQNILSEPMKTNKARESRSNPSGQTELLLERTCKKADLHFNVK